jgi:pSer/pThr/pTyr-binding forkhead associated (FHA) protein
MAKLILQFEGRALQECLVGASVVKIGRLPDNTVMIDNPAVSSHHARVFREGDGFVIEDLQSRNGTYVNQTRVTRQALHHGDVVLIGKHTLFFDQMAGGEPAIESPESEDAMPDVGGTIFLDTKQQRALLAKMGIQGDTPADPASSAAGAKAGAAVLTPKPALLRVVSGRSEQSEYNLDGHMAIVGTSETALVRLKGWFKPNTALAIARKGDGYVATALGGKNLINNQPLTGRHDLKDGDVLNVSGLTLEFRIRN